MKKYFSIMLTIFSILLFNSCSDNKKDNLTAEKIKEYYKPAVVFITNSFQGEIAVPERFIENQANIKFANDLRIQRYYGYINSDANFFQKYFDEVMSKPLDYYQPEGSMKVPAGTLSIGSGFIVTPDGYIVSNAHVVTNDADIMKMTIINQALSTLFEAQFEKTKQAFNYIDFSNPQNEEKLKKALIELYSSHMELPKDLSPTITVYMGSKVQGLGNAYKIYQAEIKDVGKVGGKDVAILKINGKDLPTTSISKEKSAVGEDVIAMGFPGIVVTNSNLSQETLLDPSATKGSINGLRNDQSNSFEYYEMSAPISNGNSGGPLFNMKGEVIGVNTLGSVKPTGSGSDSYFVQGFNYAITAPTIEEFLQRAGVTPVEGELCKEYKKAIDLYLDQHYAAAKEIFKSILEVNSSYPFVQGFIEECSSQIQQGNNKPVVPVWLIILLIISGLIIIAAILFLFILPGKFNILKKRTKLKVPNNQITPESAITKIKETAVNTPDDLAIKTKETPSITLEKQSLVKSNKFCEECGNPISETAKFCANCGNKVK